MIGAENFGLWDWARATLTIAGIIVAVIVAYALCLFVDRVKDKPLYEWKRAPHWIRWRSLQRNIRKHPGETRYRTLEEQKRIQDAQNEGESYHGWRHGR